MNFKEHLFTPLPIEELNEGAAEKIKGFLNRVSKPKHNVISYDPNMVEYQKHYNDKERHRLSNPYNKERYAQDVMNRGKSTPITPAFKQMMSMVRDDDIKKNPRSIYY